MTTLQPLFLGAGVVILGLITIALLSASATHDRDPPDNEATTHHDENGEG